MELVNVLRKAIDTGSGAGDPAVRFGAEEVAKVLSLFAPYTAEDMWRLLGHAPSVARAGWPEVDPALLMFPAVLAASGAFMLPVATAPNAIAYGSGLVSAQRMFREGAMLNVLAAAIICTVCWFAFS